MGWTSMLLAALVVFGAAWARAGDEEETGAALLERGWALFRARHYEEARGAFERAAGAAEAAGDVSTRVEALSMVARSHLVAGAKDEGRGWLERAAKLARREDPRGWSTYEAVRGRFQWKDGENEKATTTFVALYDYCREHELFDRAVDASHMVAITGSPEEQLTWARRGIEAAEAGGLDAWLGPLWNNLGVTHEDAGRLEEALEAYTRARHYHWKVGSEISKLAADWAVGHTLRRLGRHAEAKRWLRPALAWAERLQAEDPSQDEWVGHAARDLGLVAVAEGRSPDADDLLRRAHDILLRHDMPAWDPKGWRELEDARAAR